MKYLREAPLEQLRPLEQAHPRPHRELLHLRHALRGAGRRRGGLSGFRSHLTAICLTKGQVLSNVFFFFFSSCHNVFSLFFSDKKWLVFGCTDTDLCNSIRVWLSVMFNDSTISKTNHDNSIAMHVCICSWTCSSCNFFRTAVVCFCR